MLKYTDNVPYHNNEIDYEILNKLKTEHDIIIENFQPINSGIVGIIFSGIYKKENNSKVIIKILKKDITNKINNVYSMIIISY